MRLIAELQRRNVIRMAGLYLVGAWLLVQVAGTLLPVFEAPGWVMKGVVATLAVLFLPTMVFAWAFELTPEGLKRDAGVDPGQSIAPRTARRMDRMIIGVLLLALVYFGFDKFVLAPRREAAIASAAVQGEQRSRTVAADAIHAKSIAVLPFVNMSGDTSQDYFSDGISEEILNALVQVDGLKVVGRTSSFKFKGHNEDLRVIGQQLGVAHLLEGSIRKQGDSVRITAQLIKASDGFHLWSKTYDRKLTDIFAVQDEISAAIAQALAATLGDKSRHGASIDPAAYDLYLRARQRLAKRSAESVTQAVSLFEAATLTAPNFDAAYSGRARALALLWNFTGGKVGGNEAREAKAAAEKALALNAGNAEAHSALGVIHSVHLWNWDDALRETRLAITLAPNDAEVANFAGDVFRMLGDLAQGEHWERRAIELDPLLPINRSDLAWVLLMRRDCAGAVESAKKALELDPSQTGGLDALIRAYLCLGRYQDSADTLARYAQVDPDSPFLADASVRVAIKTGRRDEAAVWLANMQRRAQAGELMNYQIAQVQSMLGDYPAAAKSLLLAYQQRDPVFVADELWLLPEHWPNDPAIRAALDQPELNALFAMRRPGLAAAKVSLTSGTGR